MMKNKPEMILKLSQNCVGCLKESNGINQSISLGALRRRYGKKHYYYKRNVAEIHYYLCPSCRMKIKTIYKRRMWFILVLGTVFMISGYAMITQDFTAIIHILTIIIEIVMLNILASLLAFSLIAYRNPVKYYFQAKIHELPFIYASRKAPNYEFTLKFSNPKVLTHFKALDTLSKKGITCQSLKPIEKM